MRKIVIGVFAALLVAAAVIGARVTSAGAAVGLPDIGWAGGGYLLNGPVANSEPNRQRFEFAIRQSQVDSTTRGKPLVMRMRGFDGLTKFVVRSWPTSTYPQYSGTLGWPVNPGDGAQIGGCIHTTDGFGQGQFSGRADLYIDLGGGVEIPYLPLPQFDYLLLLRASVPFGPALRLLPFAPVPFPDVIGDLTSGAIGAIDGAFPPSPPC